MIKNLYFTCIPKNTYLKIDFVNISRNFFNHIEEKYKHFILKKVFEKNYCIIRVNIVPKKNFKINSEIFYVRKDFGVNVNLFKKIIESFVDENIYSFDSMLRTIFSVVLFNKNGLLLHSSGIVYKDKAFLFVGKSGKGKSTLIKNSCSDKIHILSDELIPLVYVKKKLVTFRSSFWGEVKPENKMFKVASKDKIYEIKNIFVLNKHIKDCIIKKLSLEESVKNLLKNNLCLFKSTFLGNKIFDTILQVSNDIKIFSLDFNKNFRITKRFLEDNI